MVKFVPMTESEFQNYSKTSIENYAQEQVKAGNWDATDALQKSEEQFFKLLPDGLATKNQHLFSIHEDKVREKIGLLWFAETNLALRPSAYIYDFLIYKEHRRKGYGKQTLRVLEEKVTELGIETIALHVFGHNQFAIDLYQKMRYKITDIQMTKNVGD